MDNSTQSFNELAKYYDNDFTNTELGKLLRSRTHDLMVNLFPAGSSVLEINCGTGEDAAFLARQGVQVLATDGSAEMINCSRDKITRLGLSDKVTLKHCRFEELDSILEEGQIFDGILSNFGGINCAEELGILSKNISQRVRQGGYIFLCIMGRWTLWEWLYLGYKRKFTRIRERICGECNWRGYTIRYFSPREALEYFEPYCKLAKISGLGLLLPPTYAGSVVIRYPKFFHFLNFIEKHIESIPGVAQFSDHFILILKRT